MTVDIIGKRIRELRRVKNITQKELANQLYMDSRTYSKIERGERKNIDVMTLLEIAQILGVDIMDLLTTNADFANGHHIEGINNNVRKSSKPILNKLDIISHEIGLLKKEIFQIKDAITQQNNPPE